MSKCRGSVHALPVFLYRSGHDVHPLDGYLRFEGRYDIGLPAADPPFTAVASPPSRALIWPHSASSDFPLDIVRIRRRWIRLPSRGRSSNARISLTTPCWRASNPAPRGSPTTKRRSATRRQVRTAPPTVSTTDCRDSCCRSSSAHCRCCCSRSPFLTGSPADTSVRSSLSQLCCCRRSFCSCRNSGRTRRRRRCARWCTPRCSCVVECGRKTEKREHGPDIKTLHAKIGQLALENNFLSGALGRIGDASAKR